MDCYIDNDRVKVDNIHVFPKEYFAGKSQEYYIAVPIGYYKSVSDSLREMGYISIKDYYYFCDCIVRAERDCYEDRHGNVVKGVWAGIKIPFCCYNVHIEIGEGAVLSNCTLNVRSNVHISIGNNTTIHGNTIFLSVNSDLVLGSDVRICSGGVIHINEGAHVTIGKGSTFGRNFGIYAVACSSIFIGDDCMFSVDVKLLSGDGHSVFDINSKENINSVIDKLKNTELRIGDHVWIGINSTIIGNTKIGNGSIVGAASLVKGYFPNNCILAGNPARIIRKNIAWSRENGAEDISLCGQENINLTQEKVDVKKSS